MFTGIIEHTGTIQKIENNLFTISHPYTEPFEIGESIALSGMCTTVIKTEKNTFTVEVMEESRNKTIFGSIKEGDHINLERAARMGARNSGHFVLGHVDQVGTITERKTTSDYELFQIKINPENEKYMVPKGSIAVDGISLTISKVVPQGFEVSIISHTLKITTLGKKKSGDKVSLEFDILGKYVIRNKE